MAPMPATAQSSRRSRTSTPWTTPWSSRPATRRTSAIISTIAGKDDYIVLDIDSHASIYDGCALGNAQIVPFRHNDIEALEKRLKRIPEGAGKLVVLEGVYSMLGDIAPLKEMVAVSKANGAMVLVDEAHSMGFIGEHGRGVAEAQGIIDDVDFIIGTFSKSVGTVGGFCVSNHPKFEILRLVCRPYVFTASLPPSVVATAATSIRKLMDSADKRAHLWENSASASMPAFASSASSSAPMSRSRRSSPSSCPTSRPARRCGKRFCTRVSTSISRGRRRRRRA